MEKFGIVILVTALFIAATLISSMLFGWGIMLAIGILHGAGVVPATVGFWPDSVGLGFLFGLMFSTFVATK